MLQTQFSKSINAVIIQVRDELYLFDVDFVKEIYVPKDKIIPVPLANKAIVGIIDIRGDIYSILSLRHIIYNSESVFNLNGKARLLLLEVNGLNIAFLVDSVVGVRELPSSIFRADGSIIKTNIDLKFVKSIGKIQNQSYLLLDIYALIEPFIKNIESKPKTIPESFPKVLAQPKVIPKTKLETKESTTVVITPKTKLIKKKIKVEGDTLALSSEQQDVLKEVGNIGAGNAVTALSRLIKKKINVNLTDVGIISFDQLAKQFGGPKEKVCGIFSNINKPSQSTILQVFNTKPLMKLIATLVGDKSKIDPEKINDKKDLDEYAISTITEMGNIMAGHYASALSDLLGMKMMINIPEFTMVEAQMLGNFLTKELAEITEYVIIIKTSIDISEYQLSGFFFLVPDIDTLEVIFNKLGIKYKEGTTSIIPKKTPDVIKMSDIKLTDVQRDALQEVGNIGAGNAANALAQMINKRVDINIPSVEMVELDKYADKISKKNEKLLVAWSNITGMTRATILSIFNINDIVDLTAIIVDDKDKKKIDMRRKIETAKDFPLIYRSAMSELGHILGSHYTTAIGDLLGIRLMTEPPDMSVDSGRQLFHILKEEIGLLKKLSLVITTNVIITDFKITGTFLFIPNLDTLQVLLDALSKFYA
ncbi:MAG: chemotaxis protein CheC [Candidatus Hermodarchaeota archaeon]